MVFSIAPTRAKFTSLFGVGHDGRPKVIIKDGHLPRPTDRKVYPADHPGNVARADGKPKLRHATPIHGGMTGQQKALKGMSHATGREVPDASSPNPVCATNYAASTKAGRKVPIKAGMRSRRGEITPFAPGVAMLSNHLRRDEIQKCLDDLCDKILSEAVRTP
jgi:hypothetical protein